MPYIEHGYPDGSSLRLGISLDELLPFAQRWFPRREPDLRYDLPHAAAHYGQQDWVQTAIPGGILRVPYTLEHAYSPDATSWGAAILRGTYLFPAELEQHRKACVKRFKKEGRLSKGDSVCPRVVAIQSSPAGLVVRIERARYLDQVGTNLTLDRPLTNALVASGYTCSTIREWDVRQAGYDQPVLPRLEESRLANTIGISIGITCRSRDGRLSLLQRRRSKGVAVHQNMWASPFAFALALPSDIADGEIPLELLISRDFGHEFAEELELEHDLFSTPRPVALCRDLTRGGKPQFFFEMRATPSLEELITQLGATHREFRSKVRRMERIDIDDDGSSVAPELMCLAALLARRDGLPALGV